MVSVRGLRSAGVCESHSGRGFGREVFIPFDLSCGHVGHTSSSEPAASHEHQGGDIGLRTVTHVLSRDPAMAWPAWGNAKYQGPW